jgi:hypothetical protein
VRDVRRCDAVNLRASVFTTRVLGAVNAVNLEVGHAVLGHAGSPRGGVVMVVVVVCACVCVCGGGGGGGGGVY